MTEEQYIRSKISAFDWICAYSWFLPLTYLITIMGLIAFEYELSGGKVGFIFGLLVLTNIVSRGVVLANKVEKWKQEYYRLKK